MDAYFLIKAGDEKERVVNDTGKTTLAIHLGKAWRNILLSERAFQWASIPKVLDRISNEEVKQHYDNTNALLVTELGYYLYEKRIFMILFLQKKTESTSYIMYFCLLFYLTLVSGIITV